MQKKIGNCIGAEDTNRYIFGSVLQKKFGADGGNDFKEFSDMIHGWVSRGDISDPKIAEQVGIAMDGVLKFFSKYL